MAVVAAALALSGCAPGESDADKMTRQVEEQTVVVLVRDSDTDFSSLTDAEIKTMANKGCEQLASGMDPEKIVAGLAQGSDSDSQWRAKLILWAGSGMICEEHKLNLDDLM